MGALVRRIIDGTNYLIIINRKANMSTTSKAPEYMLIFRGTDWHKGLSPEQMQQIASQWMAWFQGLTSQGKAIAGNPRRPLAAISYCAWAASTRRSRLPKIARVWPMASKSKFGPWPSNVLC